MIKRIKTYIAILFITATTAAVAQNNTNSPYSRFGYGELEEDCFAMSQGLGGASIALRSKQYINPVNPASYSSPDSTTFIFDLGVSLQLANFNSGNGYNNKFNGNLDYIALQTPLFKWMGLSAGLIPYSHVGYNFYNTDSIVIPGSTVQNIYKKSYYGTGSLTQAYLGLSFNIAKHLSIGANGYFLFGTIENYRALSYESSELNTTATIQNSALKIKSLNARFGIQYHETIGERHAFTIGAIYEFKSGLNGQYNVTTESLDTISTSASSQFQLPAIYGGGVSYTYDNRIMVTADYKFTQFSKALYYGVTDSLADQHKIAVGAQYTHKPMGRRYVDRMQWRIGANHQNSYVKAGKHSLQELSLTCGVGLPLRTTKTMINVNFEYRRVGLSQLTTLAENQFKLTLNFSLNEIWYQKAKIR